jgi:tRNA pseudouridine38-40 synthase
VRLRATIEYKGTHYAGWQVQPDQPTVQSALEKAIEVATGVRSSVVGAGRTDSGVHALGQVAAFDVPDEVDVYRLRAQLNGLTAHDISVVTLERTADDFDPRRAALRRTYEYTIVSGRPRSPMLDDRCWFVYPELDLEHLQRLADRVVGEHDFSAFRASDCESETTVREVFESRWSAEQHIYRYRIAANAFLKQMVRILVGSMADVVLGKLDESTFTRLLAQGGWRSEAGRTAPAEGLTLLTVDY